MKDKENMENRNDEEKLIKEIKKLSIKYSAAMKQIETYLKILEEDFTFRNEYNPIDHIVTRLKTPESILGKMQKDGKDKTIEEIEKHLFDIAGVRIVCPFEDDVERVVEILKESNHINIIKEKDFITNPKESGYRSYHLVVMAHVHLISGNEDVPVEIQIRTLAQDFWASLEHQITYKYKGEVPEYISKELKECSDVANLLDMKMMDISNDLHSRNI